MAGILTAVAIPCLISWGKDAPPLPEIKVQTTPVNRDVKLGVSFAPIVKEAAPSVVNIYSTQHFSQRPFQILFLTIRFSANFSGINPNRMVVAKSRGRHKSSVPASLFLRTATF